MDGLTRQIAEFAAKAQYGDLPEEVIGVARVRIVDAIGCALGGRGGPTLPELASAPKPGKPGPGRPPGSKNRHPATRHDVGKTVKRDQPKKESHRQKA